MQKLRIFGQNDKASRPPDMRQTPWIAVILCVTAPWRQPADEFTFKRIKVGEGLPGKRITVQIDPEEQARYLAACPRSIPTRCMKPR
jgi:hypothetical protein